MMMKRSTLYFMLTISLLIFTGWHTATTHQSKQASRTVKTTWQKNYTSASFWWGTRYYFTSNQAVVQMQAEHANNALAWGAVGAIGGAISGGVTFIAGEATAIYFTKQANDLSYYNARHRHHRIYMDVTATGIYSLHVLT